jgi:NAD(P)-dependent dehydrogenase (short-subunit alcohol dehydrogenase family)
METPQRQTAIATGGRNGIGRTVAVALARNDRNGLVSPRRDNRPLNRFWE